MWRPRRSRDRLGSVDAGGDEIGTAGGRIKDEKVFVELRRLDCRAGEHGVRLAAMVDLMQEKVRQQIADGFVERTGTAAVSRDAPGRIGGTEAVAEGDEASVAIGLRGGELFHISERLEL